jgi:dCTP deaminase
MAVLGREAILQAMESGAIGVTPFDRERLGPASLDLTLARTFRVFRKVHQVIDVYEHTDYRELTEKIEVPDGEHILIMPGETVLGITQERLRLGPAPLAVHPGTAICQFVFQILQGS